jgi:thiol-disulfide isomerase/thioredoxin
MGVAAAVVIAAIIAIAASRDSSPDATGGLRETGAVKVTGHALAPYEAGDDPAVGSMIPRAEGQSFDGSPVTIAADGRPKIIVFVAHWCPHCRREVPILVAHMRSQPLPDGIDLLTVATGTQRDAPNYPPSAWLRRENWPGPVLADSDAGDTGERFGLTSYPYFVAVGRSGAVVARAAGELTPEQFDALVQQAMAAA